jgi:hypothetical protein
MTWISFLLNSIYASIIVMTLNFTVFTFLWKWIRWFFEGNQSFTKPLVGFYQIVKRQFSITAKILYGQFLHHQCKIGNKCVYLKFERYYSSNYVWMKRRSLLKTYKIIHPANASWMVDDPFLSKPASSAVQMIAPDFQVGALRSEIVQKKQRTGCFKKIIK